MLISNARVHAFDLTIDVEPRAAGGRSIALNTRSDWSVISMFFVIVTKARLLVLERGLLFSTLVGLSVILCYDADVHASAIPTDL